MLLAFLLLSVAAGVSLSLLGISLDSLPSTGELRIDPDYRAGTALISLLVILLGVVGAARRIDHRPLSSLGFHLDREWWRDLGFGLLLGAGLMTGIFVVQWGAGWVTVSDTFQRGESSFPFGVSILFMLVSYGAVGIQEELLARGYLLQNLAEGLNLPALTWQWATLLAWLLSSALFGLAHAANPHASLVSTFNLTMAGLFLGLGYMLTGELALSSGLHITWNFFQGVVFGFPVSGLAPSATFLGVTQDGPEVLTGGAFGPEAGLIGLLATIIGCLFLLLWVYRRRSRLALDDSIAEYHSP